MGTDPGSSVTTTYGQVWDTPNVFVTGAALFPQNAGANPTGTIGAVTYRLAEALEQRYFKDPGQLLEESPRREQLGPRGSGPARRLAFGGSARG